MIIAGIVVASGRGERYGRPKHSLELAGRPLWKYGRDALLAGGASHVVVVGDVPDGVPGGERRQDSVAAGLAALPPGAEWVLIHDAARPLATAGLVRLVLARLLEGDVDGVVPVLPVRDTIKRVERDRVIETIDREELATVQTPQGFRVEALRAAHAGSDDDASDDALLIERTDGVVATVEGEATNVKITYPEDLKLAEALS